MEMEIIEESSEQAFLNKGSMSGQLTYEKMVNPGKQENTNDIPFSMHVHTCILINATHAGIVGKVEH
jgi:hypothetical protein